MLFIVGVIFVGIIICLIVKNNDYKIENENLKRRIKGLETELYYKKMHMDKLQDDNEVITKKKYTYQEDNVEEKITSRPENKVIGNNIDSKKMTQKVEQIQENDEGVKNKFLLMTGAVLIVLAAIVFLTSTWYTIPNIIKTVVIVLLTGVFIGASNIAKKVFKLEETANTFLYIALAYLPIALGSISLFGLLGDYLSIYGEGKYLYFAICTIFLSILYFAVGDKRKQKALFNSSMVMQILSVVFLSQCINSEFSTAILGITIYNIVLTFIKKKYFKEYINEINVYNYVYLYGVFVVESILLIKGTEIIDIIINALMIYSFYLKYKENKNYYNRVSILTEILVFVLSIFTLSKNMLDISIKEGMFYIIVIGMYLYGGLSKDKEWKKSSVLVSTVAMVLLYIWSFGNEGLILKNYMIFWTINVLNIISYNVLKDRSELFVNLIPIGIFGAQLNTVLVNNLNINYLVFTSLAVFVFSILNLLKSEELNGILQVYANIMMVSSSLISISTDFNIFIDNVIIFILIMAVYFLGFIKNNDRNVYKIVAYVISNVALYSILHRYNLLEYAKYIMFITTIIITAIETRFKNLQDDYSYVYLVCSYIMAFITLNFGIDMVSFLLILTLSVVFELFIKNKDEYYFMKLLPFIALVPSVYFSEWALFEQINLMIFVNFALIVLSTLLSIRNDKINKYTVISGIYILMQMYAFDFSIYTNLVMALIWALIHLLKKKPEKSKFEVISYFVGLILYNNIVGDISDISSVIDSITAFKYLGYIVFSFLITRRILKKYYNEGYKAIEYIVCFVIYLAAISNYTSQMDGMIFVYMLVIITIISYIKKYGPIFFSTIIAILLNVFLLTREFWFSIPWWVYMLTIGSVLILFAVNNELNENRKKELLKSKFKSFRDYIDM